MYDFLAKIVIVGDSFTGKTSVLQRFTDNIFEDNYACTIGVDFKVKTIKIKDKEVKLMIYDTTGAERFKALSNSFYRGSNAIIFVYDVTNMSSFKNLLNWMEEVDMYTEDTVKILVGNKIDLLNKIQVPTAIGREFADNNGMYFLECSAKEHVNIDDIFFVLVKKLTKNMNTLKETKMSKSIILHTENLGTSKSCCSNF